ncbi:GAF domain-containing sensor histidine kinase [Thermopolyspora sp. NPDC052614]|uniref:sensor histidine kinase n=1 Tax=Thermopolyspora sp. NPDC052614 TaxID=3155682 RepID=UPI00343CD00C
MRDKSVWRAVTAGSALIIVVVAAVVVEPRLVELGAAGIVERFDAFRAVAGLAFGLPGVIVVTQRPGNRIGWLMVAIGAAQAVGVALGSYGLLGIYDGGLPGDDWAMWVSNWIWVPAYVAVPTLFPLLFPDGRLPSRRWWPAVAAALTGMTLGTLEWALRSVALTDIPGLFPPGYVGLFPGLNGLPDVGDAIAACCLIAASAASIASLFVRYRRAGEGTGREEGELVRRRLQWVLAAALLTAALLGLGFLIPGGPVLVTLAAVPLPAAVGVAVVVHRLWDLDLLLSRALASGAVAVILLAAYALAAFALGDLLGAGLTAVVVAFAVHPLYVRAVAKANRLVYGDRDDPARALRRLGARLTDAGTAGELLDRMAAEIARTLRIRYVAVEESGTIVARAGAPGPVVETVPLLHQGEPVGSLIIGERARPKVRALLAELAPHVAVAVHAHRLRADLERSHARLLAARQEERDRLLYELHDGLGPTLAALALQVDRGRRLVEDDPEEVKRLLGDLSARIRVTVDDVRAIVNDLRPPPLDDLGLAGALVELGRGFQGDLAVEVDTPSDLPVLPAPAELAAYRIAAEALTNAARHATASRCVVRLRAAEMLELEVDDDGVGVSETARRGFGLASMRRRAEELDGTFDLVGGAGGTRVVVRLPLGGVR